MKELYNEKHFYINLIASTYKTNKPSFISMKIKEDLNEDITPSEVYDYLNLKEDFEKESRTIKMNDIFDRDAYEEKRHQDMLSYMRHE